MKFAPPREQPALVVLDGPANLASERTVLDPLALDPKGGTPPAERGRVPTRSPEGVKTRI
jgi:hypothetical protein